MKILILANNDVGLCQFRRELIKGLFSRNDSVIISLPYGKLIEPLQSMGCTFIDTPIDRRGINPVTDFALFRRYLKMLKQVKPDLALTYTVKPNVYGGLACRLKKIPYAVNITGLGTAFEHQGMLRKLVMLLYELSLKKAKTVFFENAENQNFFIDQGIVREAQICLLAGAGVNLEHYQVAEYPVGDCTKFLFIGRIMKEKGIDELFAAMRKLVEEGLACTLDVLGNYEENYKNIIARYEAEGWLHYHGYQQDVRPFIEAAHCFVLPSWHEGMANTNLECAAMGRPIITSAIHGCMEAVIEGESGYLCRWKDADSLYSVMKRFIGLSYDERKKMGLQGRRHMEARFDKRKVVAETLKRL